MANSRIFTDRPSGWVEQVWRENAPQIYKLCLARSRDAESARDLFQEVALRFCKAAHTLDPNVSLAPWFFAVVRNTYYEQFRRELPVAHYLGLTEHWARERCASYHAGKIRQEVCDERRARFVRQQLDMLMEGLSASEKMAVEFSCIGEIRAEDACLYCATDKGTFFKRKSKALKKMREKKDIFLSMQKKCGTYSFDLDELLTNASEFS